MAIGSRRCMTTTRGWRRYRVGDQYGELRASSGIWSVYLWFSLSGAGRPLPRHDGRRHRAQVAPARGRRRRARVPFRRPGRGATRHDSVAALRRRRPDVSVAPAIEIGAAACHQVGGTLAVLCLDLLRFRLGVLHVLQDIHRAVCSPCSGAVQRHVQLDPAKPLARRVRPGARSRRHAVVRARAPLLFPRSPETRWRGFSWGYRYCRNTRRYLSTLLFGALGATLHRPAPGSGHRNARHQRTVRTCRSRWAA